MKTKLALAGFIAASALIAAPLAPASAEEWHHHGHFAHYEHYEHHDHDGGLLLGLGILGATAAALTAPFQPVVVAPPPPPVYVAPSYPAPVAYPAYVPAPVYAPVYHRHVVYGYPAYGYVVAH